MTVVLGLAAAVAWATMNIPLQRGARVLDGRAMLFWILLAGTSVVIPVALIVDGFEGPFTPRSLIVPVLAGLIANVGFLCLAQALRAGSISVVAPIIALEGGLGTLLSIGLGERPSPLALILLAIAVAGTVMVSYEPGARAAKGALWALAAALCYAAVLTALGYTDQPALTSAGLVRSISLLAAVPLLLLATTRDPRGSLRLLLLAGALDAAGIASFAFAAAIGPSSVATVAASQFGTVAALIGIVFLRERLAPSQYVGIAVTALAITGLGAFA